MSIHPKVRGRAPRFHVIGDVHGCLAQLVTLLRELGYRRAAGAWSHPEGFRPVFVGDLVDRGPASLGVISLVRQLERELGALAVLGNHEARMIELLEFMLRERSHPPVISRGRARLVCELEGRDTEYQDLLGWLRSLPTALRLANGQLRVAHAAQCDFPEVLSAETLEKLHVFGAPAAGLRSQLGRDAEWMSHYRKAPIAVCGHTVNPVPRIEGNAVSIDQGCCGGGALTAYVFPEGRFVQVKSNYSWRRDPQSSVDALRARHLLGQPADHVGGQCVQMARAFLDKHPDIERRELGRLVGNLPLAWLFFAAHAQRLDAPATLARLAGVKRGKLARALKAWQRRFGTQPSRSRIN